jgi:hypothetical protein|nr:MAG TPA: hypothetical protein [Caudoviricetes sp.]
MANKVKRFIYNSDHPEVYVAKVFEKKFLMRGDRWDDRELHFNHGLPFVPLMRGIWSDDINFNWSNDLEVYSKMRFGNMPEIALECYADERQIHLIGINNIDPPTNVWMCVKIICLVPPDYNGDVSVFDTKGNFKFNSDNKYNKLIESGTLPSAGGTIVHNLGYIPIFWVFSGDDGQGSLDVIISETSVRIINRDQLAKKPIYYFLFGDSYES